MMDDSWAAFPDKLRALCERHGVVASEDCLARCFEHLGVLVKWNRKMNLVGDLNLDSAVERHYGESLFLASRLPQGPLRIADVGSGAGFPGAMVAAALPQADVSLVESRQKRAVFLRESTRAWPNCRVVHGMAEAIDFPVELLTTRAVATDLLTELAARHKAGLGMLVSTETAQSLRGVLKPQGFRCECVPVPWRPTSSVIVAFPA
jgi:16S rRNA G527 N7-methylase RsmG